MAAPIYTFDYVWLQMQAVRQALTGYADAPTTMTYPLDPMAVPLTELYSNTAAIFNPLNGKVLNPAQCFIMEDGDIVPWERGGLYVQIYDGSGRRAINSRGQNNNVEWTMDVAVHLAVARDPPNTPLMATKILMNMAIQVRNIVNYGKWMVATEAGAFDLFTPQPPVLSGISRVQRSLRDESELEYLIVDSFRMASYEDWAGYANTQSNAMQGAY